MNQLWLNIVIFIFAIVLIVVYLNAVSSIRIYKPQLIVRKIIESDFEFEENFDDFDNETGTADGRYIVPNYVHFIRFGLEDISFIDAVCILAAFKHQKPDNIFIHTGNETREFKGKYWNILQKNEELQKILIHKHVELPTEIFGKKLSTGWRKWHGADVMRLRILKEYGGIFLDNDSYIVRSLNDFRRYEMTLGWMDGEGLANQVIIAHKNARFLKKWLESYTGYDSTQWYYNAGIKPTKEILEIHPDLIHREKWLLANHHITLKLYLENWNEWRSHYAIHLLYNHQYMIKKNLSDLATYPVQFNENNIVNYPITIKDMVYDVYPMEQKIE